MNQTLRAWLIFGFVALLVLLAAWALPHYVAYFKVVVAEADVQIAVLEKARAAIR